MFALQKVPMDRRGALYRKVPEAPKTAGAVVSFFATQKFPPAGGETSPLAANARSGSRIWNKFVSSLANAAEQICGGETFRKTEFRKPFLHSWRLRPQRKGTDERFCAMFICCAFCQQPAGGVGAPPAGHTAQSNRATIPHHTQTCLTPLYMREHRPREFGQTDIAPDQ